jgi:Xaa-Pro aminopeptidase
MKPIPTLTQTGCLKRQDRFRAQLAAQQIDAAAFMDYRDVYYFTGTLLSDIFPVFMLLETDGGCWVVAHTDDGASSVDEWLVYEWNKMETLNFDLMHQLDVVVKTQLQDVKGRIHRLGIHDESVSSLLGKTLDEALQSRESTSIDGLLAEVQRCKELDELEMIRWSVQVNLAVYDATQAALAEGVNELAVLAEGQRAAMLKAGERLFHDGDYRCGERHGPARNREIKRGELYIIDAHTCCRGYWSDLARTFVVDSEPTDLQQSIFDHIAAVQQSVPSLLKHGARGTEIWRVLDEHIREHPALAEKGLVHHAGHGIGIRMHEPPDLNRDREGILHAGDVVCVEPGGYTPAAQYGVRIENTYLITESGCENLSEYPVNIVPAGRSTPT